MRKHVFQTGILIILALPVCGQIVAIGDFENRSDWMYLDSWTGKIPDYLQHALSRDPDIILVERHRLQMILQEQALSMTGLTDSATVQEIGRLISAQYVITGTVSHDQGRIRIDARVIHTASGKVITEKVESREKYRLNEMIALLANNLSFQLTGRNAYKSGMKIRQYPVKPFLGITLVSGITSGVIHHFYQKERRNYQSAQSLSAVDSDYRSANDLYRVRNVMISVTGAAAAGTLFCALKNLSPEEILASGPGWIPFVYVKPGETIVGLQICF